MRSKIQDECIGNTKTDIMTDSLSSFRPAPLRARSIPIPARHSPPRVRYSRAPRRDSRIFDLVFLLAASPLGSAP